MKMYIVDLDERERNELEQLTTKGRSGARKIRRARILLLADEGRIDKEIASLLGSAVTTLERVRKRFVEEGLEAALYKAFEPEEARRVLRRLEFHHTPKHASWLNQVEIELSALSRQCLRRRIPDESTLKKESAAWEYERNKQEARVSWRFTAPDAREKLKRLYPPPS